MTDVRGDTPECLNCGAALGGQYCGQCGQRASNRLISLWELLRDAFGDLFELDSRLWRTMTPLLLRPGALTRDYLEGRRARYMPPFRMYLVLSLVFFVIAFFDPREELAILYEPAEETNPELAAEKKAQEEEVTQELLEELVREGVVDPSVLEPDDSAMAAPPSSDEAAAAAELAEEAAGENLGLNIRIDDEDGSCNIDRGNFEDMPEFIKRRFSAERMEQVCNRVVEVGARGVIAALLDKIPVALLILLPLMAVVLKLLYPLSRRYYVEHLLFFVHFHSFMFLLLSLQILWSRLVAVTGLPGAVSVLPIVATSLYMPVYLYKSMRRVYVQGHILTSIKFLALSVAYSLGLTLMLLGTLLIAVFSV